MKTAALFIAITISFSASAFASSQIIPIAHANAKKVFTLKTVLLSGTNWTSNDIITEMGRANKVFSQCDLQIGQLEFEQVKATGVLSSDNQVYQMGKGLITTGFRKAREQVLILGGSFVGELLQSFGYNQLGGYSIAPIIDFYQSEDYKDALESVSIVMDITHTEDYHSVRDVNYSTIAHELSHVFMNSNHVNYPNLMASSSTLVNGVLTPEQCSVIMNSPILAQRL